MEDDKVKTFKADTPVIIHTTLGALTTDRLIAKAKSFITGVLIGCIIMGVTMLSVSRAEGAESRREIAKVVWEVAAHYEIDPYLVLAIIEVESSYNPRAVGGAGEYGLMQLHPKYHRLRAPFSIKENIWRGVAYLKECRARTRRALGKYFYVCYNLGPSRSLALKYPDKFPYARKVERARKRLLKGRR